MGEEITSEMVREFIEDALGYKVEFEFDPSGLNALERIAIRRFHYPDSGDGEKIGFNLTIGDANG